MATVIVRRALIRLDIEALGLIQPEQAQAETVRGRHLGPSRVLLVDLPWAGAEHFVKTNALRGLPDRAGRVTTLSVGGQPGRPVAGDLLDTTNRWVEYLDPDTAQEYWGRRGRATRACSAGAGAIPTPSRPLPLEGLASQRAGLGRFLEPAVALRMLRWRGSRL